MRYPQGPSSAQGGGSDAEVRGRLEIEGDCLYVALDEVGERYPIVWPAGTTWDADQRAVVSPTGVSMTVSSDVYGGGGYLDVGEVTGLLGSEAGALASRCVDNAYGEVAVVNNADEAIGPAT